MVTAATVAVRGGVPLDSTGMCCVRLLDRVSRDGVPETEGIGRGLCAAS